MAKRIDFIANFLSVWVFWVSKDCDHTYKKRLTALLLFICVVVGLVLSRESRSLNT